MKSGKYNFIVGIGRSGTTLLMSMLNSHPEIQATPEINFFNFFYNSWKNKKSYSETDFKKIEVYLNRYEINHTAFGFDLPGFKLTQNNSFADMYRNFYESFTYGNVKKDRAHFFDKNPINTIYIDEILRILPDSKFLLLVRDPRANYLSRKEKKNKRTDEIYFNAIRWNYYSNNAIKFYKKYPSKFFILKYEDFVANPDNYLRQIAVFFEFKFEPSMLDFNKTIVKNVAENISIKENQRLVTKYSDLSKPVNSDRISAWKTKLSNKEIEVISCINTRAASFFEYDMSFHKKPTINYISYFAAYCKFYLSIFKNKLEYFAPLFLKIKAVS